MSWLLESFIISKVNTSLAASLINATCLRANLTSYVLLALSSVALFFLPE